MTGYRNDNFDNYVYKSTDFGKNWTTIAGDLPQESVNVIYEDPKVAGLLYIGTDHGLYTSFNDGENWQHMGAIPNVATYDLIVHPRDLDLIVGTHGRSIYVTDVEPLQKIAQNEENKLVAFDVEDIRFSKNWGEKSHPYSKAYLPEMEIALFHNSDKRAKVKIEVLNEEGKSLTSWEEELSKGYQSFEWNCKIGDDFISKGKYELKFTLGKEEHKEGFEVK